MGSRLRLGLAIGLAVGLLAPPAAAFELGGHEIIEAVAYKRLLAMDAVPGIPGLSGRALLASLIATGVLAAPPCFDRAHPRGDCGPALRLELPLRYWPVLGSGQPDLVIDRQLGERGQCQHFMARTADGLTPIDPRFGVPGGLVTDAYRRCVGGAGAVFDGILRDPLLANWRIAGTYVEMHGIEDAFSTAHVQRDDRGAIVHLRSWTLIDWPLYLIHGRFSFPPATHHEAIDARDGGYLRWDARARDGRPCRAFLHPYAVPEECLTERARAAADAVLDFLVLTYRVRATAPAGGPPATVIGPASDPNVSRWLGFVRAHLPSAAVEAEPPPVSGATKALPRPDVFVGAQGGLGPDAWGVGVWAARLFVGPALPFVLSLSLGAGRIHSDGGNQLAAVSGLGLLLPLIRRVTIGATPAGIRLACNTSFGGCRGDAVAVLGIMLLPLGDEFWLGLEGPRYSWTERKIGETWGSLALGWSYERRPRFTPPAPADIAAWDPPRPGEVRAYRDGRWTRAVYVAATAVSQAENQFVGAGLEWRVDRDQWNRRAGFGAGAQIEVDAGRIDGTSRGGAIALAPTVRAYVGADRLALTATPALVRVGALADQAVAVDVAGRVGLALLLSRIELAVDSPPLSYISRARWHALPFTVRLGLAFE